MEAPHGLARQYYQPVYTLFSLGMQKQARQSEPAAFTLTMERFFTQLMGD
jgi:hypothetical protein